MLAIKYSKQQNSNLKKQQEKLTKQIMQEKTKHSPNQNNIDIWQEQLPELEN